MYISDTFIAVSSVIVISIVAGTLWAFAAEKVIRALARRESRRMDAARRADLRKLIASAEAKGVDVPESLRSAAA